MHSSRRIPLAVAASAALLAAATLPGLPTRLTAVAQAAGTASPIKHVVVIYQENHTFDETLGAYCATRKTPCDGYTGPVRLKDGAVVRQRVSPDIVPPVEHSVDAQRAAIDGGRMDGWAEVTGCAKTRNYACLTYYRPAQIPNLATLADHFTVSDRTFSMADSPSWGGHLYPAAATLDGFTGDNPQPAPRIPAKVGWGCDSDKSTPWSPDGGRTYRQVPSCVPKPDGSGAYKPTPVRYVPTIFDRLEKAGHSWNIYGAPVPSTVRNRVTRYIWSICPSFAECLYGPQVKKLVPSANILINAAKGTLPNYAVLTPSWSSNEANGGNRTSQHNGNSMLAGTIGSARSSPPFGRARTGARPQSSSRTTTAAASTITSLRRRIRTVLSRVRACRW